VSARSKSRKRALDVLFEADQRGANVSTMLAKRVELSGTQTPLPEYTRQIVAGVVEHWVQINALIAQSSEEWTLERMPAVDRALLRVATWEILFNDDVAAAVAIDEAVALAQSLSTDDSPSFINGVLGRIAREATT